MTEHEGASRWYDEDPVLSRAIEQLRHAPDKHQAQIALNIIKIIIEHQMEDQSDVTLDDLDDMLKHGGCERAEDGRNRRRWYDVNETLASAMTLLQDCPEDLQQRVIPSIAYMIEQTLAEKAC